MAGYKEIGANVRGGSFDSARRLIKAQEEVLGAFELYQGQVVDEVRTPWAAAKATYGFGKQLAGIQSELLQEWATAFAHSSKQTVRKATKAAGAA